MLTYKGMTLCISNTKIHTCGRELTKEDKTYLSYVPMPLSTDKFCEAHSYLKLVVKEKK